jgi:hypothetical protein
MMNPVEIKTAEPGISQAGSRLIGGGKNRQRALAYVFARGQSVA